MSASETLFMDPRELRLPPARAYGADPIKLHQQIARHGTSTTGMPAIVVYRCADDSLMIFDGVTRATRIAKTRSGTQAPVTVIGKLTAPCDHLPTVGDRLP